MGNVDANLINDLLEYDCSPKGLNKIINKHPQIREGMENVSTIIEGMPLEQQIELLKSISPIKDYLSKCLETETEQSKSSVDAEKSANELISKVIQSGNVSQECADAVVREASARANKEQEHRHKNEDADRALNRWLKISLAVIPITIFAGLAGTKNIMKKN